MRSKICLNMIVKNEAARIERCLNSVVPYIDSYAIVDTGSTDNTLDVIKKFFDAHGIPGELHSTQFKNFQQARNVALACARAATIPWDYLLLVDADMELVVEDKNFRDILTEPAYDTIQKGGRLAYYNRRLIARSTTGKYVGVTHEYLDVPCNHHLNAIWFKDYQDGANRKDKYTRDTMLLLLALKKEPKNARYQFYLAQTYRDAGKATAAAAAYSKRIKMGGWDEEVWNSRLNLAHCLKNSGDEAGFIRELLVAYNERPSRVEPLHDLAYHYRIKGMNAASIVFSEIGLPIPYSKDTLFVSDYAYKVGVREEFSICGFYDPTRRARAFKVCNDLALDKTEYTGARDLARSNLFHYLEPLSKMAPSFTPKRLIFGMTDYIPMNPSVALVNNELYTIIRTVNYEMDKDGRYLIKNTETGEITNDNPIHTRNYLAKLSNELEIQTMHEILPPLLPKPEYPLVVGFEDMRLFEFQGEMWTSSTVRELNREGWCEQVLASIGATNEQSGLVLRLNRWSKMLRPVRQHEKNWMPWIKGGAIQFAYRVNEVVDDHGQLVAKMPLALAVDHLSGGSQIIPFHGGWLALVHEARHRADNQKRYYQHRFVWFCYNGLIHYVSLPFVFHDKQIEFAAGLAWHPDEKRLVISYGIADKEAWVATVDDHDVMELLHG